MSDREPQPAGASTFTFGGASEETGTGIAGTTEAVGAGNPFVNLSNSTAAPSIPDSEPVVTTSPQQPAVNAAPRPQRPIWASDQQIGIPRQFEKKNLGRIGGLGIEVKLLPLTQILMG